MTDTTYVIVIRRPLLHTAETVHEKPSFRTPFKSRRVCLGGRGYVGTAVRDE